MHDGLYRILINKSYTGVRVYNENGETKETKACWEPIIPKKVFNEVQKILKANYRRLKPNSVNKYPYILSGITKCGSCNESLTGKSAWGSGRKKYGYYEHAWATKKQGSLVQKAFNCKPHRILAKRLEPHVWEKVDEIISNPFFAKRLIDQANAKYKAKKETSRAQKLKKSIKSINDQIETLAERLSTLPKSVSPAPIYKQMERLEELKTLDEKKLQADETSGGLNDMPAELKQYQTFLAGLQKLKDGDNPEVKARIIQKLVQKIEILPDTYKIHYYVGQNHIQRRESLDSRLFLCPEITQKKQSSWPVPAGISASKFFMKSSSNTIDNGGPCKT